MKRSIPLILLLAGLQCALAFSPARSQTTYLLGPDSRVQPGVPQGHTFQFDLTASAKYYPGTKSTVWVYVPAEYAPDKPACLCVGLDGPGFNCQTVFDNLIYKKQMPVTIGVYLSPGTVYTTGGKPVRYDRCYEWDSTNDTLDRFLVDEVLPAVAAHKTSDGRAINISTDPNDHMIYGASSGGVAAFTAAWQHPEMFRRVFTAIGTFVGMRGADTYPTLIRKTAPKPIRIFQQDGAQDSWNPLFDNWYTQNQSMADSLAFAGYDANHSWGLLDHEGSHGASVFPDAVKWLWRDYPAPIVPGTSNNTMQRTVLLPGADWAQIPAPLRTPQCLAEGAAGTVYFNDSGQWVYRIGDDGVPRPFYHASTPLGPMSAKPNGDLIAYGKDGCATITAKGSAVFSKALGQMPNGLLETSEGYSFSTKSGENGRDAGSVDFQKTKQAVIDSGLLRPTGIVLSPDHNLLFVAESHTHWVYSYLVGHNGSLSDKQRFYWLHSCEGDDDAQSSGGDYSDATDMACDTNGNLYVATRMGVQICDRNGRVEAILTLPSGRAVTSLCFGGRDNDMLYAICSGKIYRRQMQAHGVPPWAPPITLPGFGAG